MSGASGSPSERSAATRRRRRAVSRSKAGPDAVVMFDLETTYLAVDGRGGVVRLPVDPDFWRTIDRNEALADASLLGVFPMQADWAHWEMHPAGDEVLVLLDGAATMIFEESGAQRRIEMKAGTTLV